MSQSISPRMFFAIIAVLVLLAGGVMTWVWSRPSSSAVTSGDDTPTSKEAGSAARDTAKYEHGGPTPEQRQQIQEWKNSHPNATTKY